jgi:hypothetical protein
VGARRPAINGGGGRLGAAPVAGRGRAEAAVGEWGSALMARWRRRTGAGEPGRRDGRRGRPARPGEGRRREVGDGADGWAPSVGERERGGREGHWWAVCGPKASVGPRKE